MDAPPKKTIDAALARRLAPEDIERIEKNGIRYAVRRGHPPAEAEEMAQQALEDVASGKTEWPADASLQSVVFDHIQDAHGTMRKSGRKKREVAYDDDRDDEAPHSAPTPDVAVDWKRDELLAARMYPALVESFAKDRLALVVIELGEQGITKAADQIAKTREKPSRIYEARERVKERIFELGRKMRKSA